MRFIDFVCKNIYRRATRSILTVSGVALAVAAIVALLGVAHSLEHSLLTMFQKRGVDLVVVRAGGLQRLSSVLDETLGEQIGRLPGVERVSGGLVEVFSFEDLDLFGVLVRGVPPDTFLLDDVKFTTGRRLNDADERAVVLGKVLAANLEKGVGDSLEILPGEVFHVVGIYESFNIFENGLIVTSLRELQQLIGREGEVTAFTVLAERSDAKSVELLRDQIKELAPYLEALPTREYAETSVEIRLARAVAWMTSTLALVIGTIGMVNTMLMAVFERTRELAVLRAIGWRKWNIMKLILWESILLGLMGAVAGTLMAAGVMWLLNAVSGSARLLSAGVSLEGILRGFAVALLVGLAGGLYPAYRAARLIPTEGLRHE